MNNDTSNLASTNEITRLEQQVADGTTTPQSRFDLARAYHEAGQLALQQNRPTDAQNALAQYLRLAPTSKERHETLWQLQNLVGDEPLVCEGCGRKSPIASAFQLSRADSGDLLLLCPRCRQTGTSNESWWNNSLVWIAMSGLVALVTIPLGGSVHFVISNVFLLLLCLPLVVILHEGVRVLVTILLGGTVFGVEIGRGTLLWEKRIQRCILTVRHTFTSSGSWIGFPQNAQIIFRFFIAITVPVLIQLLVFLFSAPLEVRAFVTGYEPLLTFNLVNLFWIFFVLSPRNYELYGAEEFSVGTYLILLVQRRISANELLRLYFVRTVIVAMNHKDYARTLEFSDAGLIHFPNEITLSKARVHSLGKLEQHEAMQEQYLSLVTHKDLSQIDRGILKNNFAWFLLLSGKSETALVVAREAYKLTPWLPTVEGTFGAALVETGDVDAGILLLKNAKEISGLPEEHASYLAHLALGYAKLGNMTESQQYWEQAIKLAPQEETVAHIRPKLERIGY